MQRKNKPEYPFNPKSVCEFIHLVSNGGTQFKIPASIDQEKKTNAWKRARILNIQGETQSTLATGSNFKTGPPKRKLYKKLKLMNKIKRQ